MSNSRNRYIKLIIWSIAILTLLRLPFLGVFLIASLALWSLRLFIRKALIAVLIFLMVLSIGTYLQNLLGIF